MKLLLDLKKCFTNKQNFDVLYTPGNHCFGAGDSWLFDKLFVAPMTTLVSNIDLKKSPLFAKIVDRFDKFNIEKVYSARLARA